MIVADRLASADQTGSEKSTDIEQALFDLIGRSAYSRMTLCFDIADHLELLEMSDVELSEISVEERLNHYTIRQAGQAAIRSFSKPEKKP